MNKEMITRRAFAGLAAGGAASTLAACNSDVMQAILNPDSILGGAGQTDPQGGTGDTPSQSDFVKLEEIPDNPTLTGDLAKILVFGVLIMVLELKVDQRKAKPLTMVACLIRAITMEPFFTIHLKKTALSSCIILKV